MGSIMTVNVWRGTPFLAITILAGLQTIPRDLYEAASIDGAGRSCSPASPSRSSCRS